jgi:hypothetical protein
LFSEKRKYKRKKARKKGTKIKWIQTEKIRPANETAEKELSCIWPRWPPSEQSFHVCVMWS